MKDWINRRDATNGNIRPRGTGLERSSLSQPGLAVITATGEVMQASVAVVALGASGHFITVMR